jgi:hypothetical protein
MAGTRETQWQPSPVVDRPVAGVHAAGSILPLLRKGDFGGVPPAHRTAPVSVIFYLLVGIGREDPSAMEQRAVLPHRTLGTWSSLDAGLHDMTASDTWSELAWEHIILSNQYYAARSRPRQGFNILKIKDLLT